MKFNSFENYIFNWIPINFPNINPENLVKEIEVIIKIDGIKLNENLRPLGIGLK
nr:11697_t:CDS:2 [Entrophospora candida]